ncbi:MAG: crotonase/enoyl-CoA hydratase family protein [Candidatus Hydrogenedentes bacterium]|nr:crotonase/enoyl-CoA hydratase family protein [Candidatus Hydrogenedentota bacterium]
MSERHPHGQITVETRDHILLMGIDRAEKRNGFTPKMVHELTDAYNALETDDELWCGVLFAHGNHFTGGLDLPMFAESFAKNENFFTGKGVDILGLEQKCSKPLVCAVQGITYTIGIELMLACDIVVAATDCRFSQLEPKRGIMAVGGATMRFVQRCGWGNAMYHLLTADEFNADEAYRVGLVQEVVEPGAQVERAIELAETINSCAPLAVRATIASSRLYLDDGERAAYEQFGPTQARLGQSEDFQEGIQSFVERRKAVFKGR